MTVVRRRQTGVHAALEAHVSRTISDSAWLRTCTLVYNDRCERSGRGGGIRRIRIDHLNRGLQPTPRPDSYLLARSPPLGQRLRARDRFGRLLPVHARCEEERRTVLGDRDHDHVVVALGHVIRGLELAPAQTAQPRLTDQRLGGDLLGVADAYAFFAPLVACSTTTWV